MLLYILTHALKSAVQDTFGLSSLYLAFAVIGLGALAVVYASVPETRGKTLEEIEAFWGGNDDNNSP